MKYFVYVGNYGLEEFVIFCEISEDQHADKAVKLGVVEEVIAGGFSDSLTSKLGRDVSSRGEIDEKLFKLHNRTSSMV